MSLSKNLSREQSERGKARLIWDHYISRKRNDQLEPEWTHPAYELARIIAEGGKLEGDDLYTFRQVVGSHELPDGYMVRAFPHHALPIEFQPTRYVHDGWKMTTPSWVFMARKAQAWDATKGWVIVGREIPKELHKEGGKTIYIAYHRQHPMGITAMTANVIGPHDNMQQIYNDLKEEGVSSEFLDIKEQGVSVHDGQHRYTGGK